MNHRAKRRRKLQIQRLHDRRALTADFELIDTVRDSELLNGIVASDAAIFFLNTDAQHGQELWRADRDGGNPRLVKDIQPGPQGSKISAMTIVNDQLFFTANDGIHGQELWATDGSAENTRLVLDLYEGPGDGFVSNLNPRESNRPLISIGNDVYFEGSTGDQHTSLWASDGTQEGTLVLSEPIPAAALSSRVDQAIEKNGQLLFIQTVRLSAIEGSRNVFVGNRENGFSARNDIPVEASISPPLEILTDLPRGLLFSFNTSASDQRSTYSFTADGQVEKISEFVPLSSEVGLSSSADGYAIGIKVYSADQTTEAFLTDGTAIGTSKLNLDQDYFHITLLSQNRFVAAASSSSQFRSLIDLSDPLNPLPIDFSPKSLIGIQQYAISPTSFLAFELTNLTDDSSASARHALRLIDVEQQTSRIVFAADEDTAISEVLIRGQQVYTTLVTKNATRVAKLDLATSSSVLETLVTFPTANPNESVDIQLIDNTLFVEFVSLAKSEILLEEATGLRVFAATTVGHPGWQDYVSPFSQFNSTTTDFGVVRARQTTVNQKNLSTILTVSPELTPTSTTFVDLDRQLLQTGGFQSTVFGLDGSVLYFVSGMTIDANALDHVSLIKADATGATQELFQVRKDNVASISGQVVSALGVHQGRFYFAAFQENAWSLYRTNSALDNVEIVSESFAGPELTSVESLSKNSADADRLLLKTTYGYSNPDIDILELDIASDSLSRLYDGNTPATAHLAKQPVVSGARRAIWVPYKDSSNLVVEVGTTGVLRDFFSDSQALELDASRLVASRIDNAWIVFATSTTAGTSIWRLTDGAETAEKLSEFADATALHSTQLVAMTDRFVLFQIVGSSNFWSVGNNAAGIQKIKDAEGREITGGLFTLVPERTAFESLFVLNNRGANPTINSLAQSGDQLIRLGQLPKGFDVGVVEQSGDDIIVIGRGPDRDVYRLIRNPVSVTTADTETQLSFGRDADGTYVINSNGALTRELDQATGAIAFEDFGRAIEFTIDVGNVTSSSLPRGGMVLSLLAGSSLRLTGSTAESVTYTATSDSLNIRIGEKHIAVALRGPVVIDDRIESKGRRIHFDEANDDITLSQTADGRVQLKELNRDLTILFPHSSPISNPSNAAFDDNVAIDTGRGTDRIHIMPELTQAAQIRITSGLDAQSRLKLVMPEGISTSTKHSSNGRDFQTTQRGALQVQFDISNRRSHNLIEPADADGDGTVRPLDALRIINLIAQNNRGVRTGGLLAYGDVNGDAKVTPLDALLVITKISRQSWTAASEGRSLAAMGSQPERRPSGYESTDPTASSQLF